MKEIHKIISVLLIQDKYINSVINIFKIFLLYILFF